MIFYVTLNFLTAMFGKYVFALLFSFFISETSKVIYILSSQESYG